MKNKSLLVYVVLHLILLLYSLGGYFTKKAASFSFLSRDFCINYGIILVILVIYAISWQQIIKYLPLTTAYANKAVTVIWGMVWGMVFFGEKITAGKVAGACLVIAGVVLYVFADKEVESDG